MDELTQRRVDALIALERLRWAVADILSPEEQAAFWQRWNGGQWPESQAARGAIWKIGTSQLVLSILGELQALGRPGPAAIM